jgi:hypothetical protein
MRDGDLEHYLGITKDLSEVIDFCSNRLPQYLRDDRNPLSIEMREIVRQISL